MRHRGLRLPSLSVVPPIDCAQYYDCGPWLLGAKDSATCPRHSVWRDGISRLFVAMVQTQEPTRCKPLLQVQAGCRPREECRDGRRVILVRT